MPRSINVSPHYYAEVKARAIELLTGKDGYNNLSAQEIAAWGTSKTTRPSRNAIWVAIGEAITELQRQRRMTYRGTGFNPGTELRLVREITREFIIGTMRAGSD